MSLHLLWLWSWFGVGMVTYMLKRAYYLVTGPNPVANSYSDFIIVAWIPLLFRTVVDSAVYWAAFTPQILQAGLNSVGFDSSAWVVSVITQFGVCALFFGLVVDTLADWAIGTVVSKIPLLKDFWPQMPNPLPKKPPTQ